MKSKDWALIAVIIIVVGVASYFLVNALLPPPNSNLQTIPEASVINASVGTVPTDVFNKSAISPAFPVNIGNTSNSSPFTSSQQGD